MTVQPETEYRLVIGDVLEELPAYKETFDLIIADPPFGIEFNKSSHEYGSKDYLLYEDKFTADSYEEFSFKWISLCHDALKPHGSAYIISGWTRLREILNAIHRTRFHLINHLIWAFSWGVYARKKYVTSHYHVLFVVKDKKNYYFKPHYVNPETKRKGNPYERDVIFFPEYNRGNDPDRIKIKEGKNHPCQLPVALMEKFIKISSKPGDWVGDVFSGSGTTTLACRKLGRNVIAFEKRKEYEAVIKEKARFGQPV